MCGIVGTVPSRPDRILEAALEVIAHRGPDGRGKWHQDQGLVSFGHNRLSILDLSELGAQPMHYLDLTITFNGEIFNYLEIRNELIGIGYSFQSECDTEVVLAAYHAWGGKCVRRFNGMWAFGIWDETKQELFLSRDRYGEKPLYYARVGGDIQFASEMTALVPFLERLEPSADFDWCRRNTYIYEGTDRCLIAGIKRFPTSHNAVYTPSDRQLKLSRYWNTLDEAVPFSGTYEEATAQFKVLFADACRIRLRSDVPVGISLSGGVDSSVVAAGVATALRTADGRFIGERPKAYVASFPNTPVDETPYAKLVIDRLGLEGKYLDMAQNADFSTMEANIGKFAEISGTSPVPMIELYQTFRRNGTIVTMDGHGADEALSGYNDSILYAILDDLYDTELQAERWKIISHVNDGQGKVSFISKAKQVAKFAVTRTAGSILSKEILPPFINNKFYSPYPLSLRRGKLSYFNSHLYELTHETILPTLLRNFDRYSMLASVESRMPFMDHRIITFFFSLPNSYKLMGGFSKSVVRDAFAKELPHEVIYRRAKVGFVTPTTQWAKTIWREPLMDIAHSPDLLENPYLNGKKIAAQIQTVINDPNSSFRDGVHMWQELQAYLWTKNVLKPENYTLPNNQVTYA